MHLHQTANYSSMTAMLNN